MYPIPAVFVLKSSDVLCADDSLLILLRSSCAEELRRLSLSRIAFCAARCDEKSEEILVYDDGGNEIGHHHGIVFSEEEKAPDVSLVPFAVSDCLCGLSGGADLLFPEHSRALSLAGVELLCCFPSMEAFATFPLGEFARIRAAENQIFIAFVPPHHQEPVRCWGPAGDPVLPSPSDSGESVFLLKREHIARVRKTISLLSLRKKRLRYALTTL